MKNKKENQKCFLYDLTLQNTHYSLQILSFLTEESFLYQDKDTVHLNGNNTAHLKPEYQKQELHYYKYKSDHLQTLPSLKVIQ